MNRERDTTRIVRSWLETGVTELPDRVLDQVLDQLPATPQRRPLSRVPGSARASSAFKLTTAAAAVVAAAIVAIDLFTAGSSPGVGAAPASQAVPHGTMAPGRYHIDINVYRYRPGTTGDDTSVRLRGGVARVSFDVPAGWTGMGWAIVKGEAAAPDGVSVAPWTVQRVYRDPCHTVGAEGRGDIADPPLVGTLDGLAGALTTWWAADGRFAPTSPTATKPTNAPLAGFPGQYVEVTAPSSSAFEAPGPLGFARCDGGAYVLWRDEEGGTRYLQGPGQLERLWIVDVTGSDPQVHGGLLVIEASSHPGTSAKDHGELEAIIDSIDIEVRGGGS